MSVSSTSVGRRERPARRETAPLWRMAAAQTWAVLLFYRRSPMFIIFSAVFPIFFYAIFGLTFGGEKLPGGLTVSALIMAHMAAYSVSSVMVLNIGIGQANRRAQKLDLLQRATPLPPWVAIFADAIGGLALSLCSVLVLFLFAAVAGGVRLDALLYLDLLWRLLLGALPMLGLGLAIGYAANAQAAPAIANLIYLPMSFLSGIFIPLQVLPSFVQQIAPYFPTYHYAQLVEGPLGTAKDGLGVSLLWLVAWGLVLFAAGIRFYRLDQRRKFA